MVHRLTSLVALFFYWCLFLFSHLTPRSKHIWVFRGWQKSADREVFSDNGKYLFLETVHNHPDITPVWLCRDRLLEGVLQEHGYRAYYQYSIPGIWFALRAKYVFLTANLQTFIWSLTGGAHIIMLWHGDGIKDMQLLTPTNAFSINKLTTPGLYRRPTFYITSSEFTAQNFIIPSFNVTADAVRITGLPRYDALTNTIAGSEIDLQKPLEAYLHKIKKTSQRVILYAPTFRRGKDASFIFDHLHFEILNEFLVAHNYHFVISMHPKFSERGWNPGRDYSNIYFAEPGWDRYPLLQHFDILVTDYSSTFFEFLFLDKLSIFYAFDFEEYNKKQGLQEEIWNTLPGTKVYDFNTLLETLKAPTSSLSIGNKEARERIFRHTDNQSSARVINEIKLLSKK